MKKTFRNILAIVMIAALAFAALPALAEKGEPVEIKGNTYTNEFIKLTVSNNGRVNSFTTADGLRLLYGHSSGMNVDTSYTTVSVGGTRYTYGSSLSVSPDFDGKTNYSAQTFNGILVEQQLTIVPNVMGEDSVVEWRYTYTNTSSASKNVGCRIMLDTCLDDNDGAPFRLPNVNSISYETQITSDIPRTWFTFDDDITAEGSFSESEIMPDTLQFAEWRYEEGFIFTTEYGLYVTNWDYAVDNSEYIDDSAVAATWHETALAPGESRDYVAYYGIGEVMQHGQGNLNIAVNGDHGCVANETEDGYTPSPAFLMGILENDGNGPLSGVYERCELPEGLSFVPGTDPTYAVGNLAAGEEDQTTWNFTVDSISSEDRWFSIYIYYGCDNMEESYVVWNYFVPGIEQEPPVEPVPPVVISDRVELRARAEEDNKADLRFMFLVLFNDSNIVYKNHTYGPAEDYSITDFYAMLTANGKTIRVNGTNIYEMYGREDEGPYFVYTAVLKSIKEANFDLVVTAQPYVEYVRVSTGVTGIATDEPLTGSVNGVAND